MISDKNRSSSKMATANDSPTNFSTASVTSAMQRLMLDSDLADLTVTCGNREWKVHSTILAIRSPFFKAAVTTNMVEKLEMNIDIKVFDPNAMEEVINFMYGIPKENAPVQFMFEAAERFQMNDLKEYAVKIAKKEMSVEIIVELQHIAELYSIEYFLANCAAFIVKNDVPLSGEDTSPKLAVMVVSILRGDIQKLNDDILKLKGALQDSENKLKAEVEWMWLAKLHVNGQGLQYVGNGYDKGSALGKMPLSKSNHYFKVEIIDPGSDCWITIGLARKDYPRGKFPGGAEGSIEYNGPLFTKGDIMGCGVMFPSKGFVL